MSSKRLIQQINHSVVRTHRELDEVCRGRRIWIRMHGTNNAPLPLLSVSRTTLHRMLSMVRERGGVLQTFVEEKHVLFSTAVDYEVR